jgi:hypothetical protein
MTKAQSFEHHAKFFPPFHFVAGPILIINLVSSIYRVIHAFSAGAVMALLLAVGLLALAMSARMMVLKVQDRVIRLEMRLRMAEVLPPDLRARIGEFSVGQLVALRFAGDAELPELSRQVLANKMTDRPAIKKLIRDWQPDFQRA